MKSLTKNNLKPSKLETYVGKQNNSSSNNEESVRSSGCEQTFAETILSSNWSQSLSGNNNIRMDGGPACDSSTQPKDCTRHNPLSYFQNCLVCFWPTMYGIGMDNTPNRANCFVDASESSGLVEADYWHGQFTPVLESKNSRGTHPVCQERRNSTQGHKYEENSRGLERNGKSDSDDSKHTPMFTPKMIFSSKLPFIQFTTEANDSNSANIPKLTPITFDSKTTFADMTPRNGGTLSTANTLHRRTDASVGFFSAEMEVIHSKSSPLKSDRAPCDTPCHNQSNDPSEFKFDEANVPEFKTPSGLRDSSSFRKNIKVVTCEKKPNEADDDVSPMGSDDGFSGFFNAVGRRSSSSNISRPLSSKCAHKNLPVHLDDSAQRKQVRGTPDTNRTEDCSHFTGINLFGDFRGDPAIPIDNNLSAPKVGMNVMKSVQSFLHWNSAVQTNMMDASDEKENERSKIVKNNPKGNPKTQFNPKEQPNDYLQKSISFIKILRKTGRRGKPLFQGWVAFRQTSVSWTDIIRDAKRCDFRYIVILDDMPLLHIFSTRTKQKKGKKKQVDKPIEGCVSLELTDEIAVQTKIVSKALGNEVRLVDIETGQRICSMLPVRMAQNLFLDKHRSRLAKSEILQSVFSRTKSPKKEMIHDKRETIELAVSKWGDPGYIDRFHAPMEQNDASRHLLFVLDAAIKFPIPRV